MSFTIFWSLSLTISIIFASHCTFETMTVSFIYYHYYIYHRVTNVAKVRKYFVCLFGDSNAK